MSSQKPVILLVHGLWHSPGHYTPLTDKLVQAGYEVNAPSLPSTGGEIHQGLHGDAVVVHQRVKDLISAGKDVLLVAHSYGGMVATEAVKVTDSKKSRSFRGLSGGVIGITYLCAFLPLPGQSLFDVLGGRIPPFTPVDETGRMVMLSPKERFGYPDSPDSESLVALLKPVSFASHSDQSTNAGYLFVPSLYIYATDDKAIVHPLQEKMVRAVEAYGVTVHQETIEDGHSPQINHPHDIAALIEKHLAKGTFAEDGMSKDQLDVQQRLLEKGIQRVGEIYVELQGSS